VRAGDHQRGSVASLLVPSVLDFMFNRWVLYRYGHHTGGLNPSRIELFELRRT
jgi:hypothetical protein